MKTQLSAWSDYSFARATLPCCEVRAAKRRLKAELRIEAHITRVLWFDKLTNSERSAA